MTLPHAIAHRHFHQRKSLPSIIDTMATTCSILYPLLEPDKPSNASLLHTASQEVSLSTTKDTKPTLTDTFFLPPFSTTPPTAHPINNYSTHHQHRLSKPTPDTERPYPSSHSYAKHKKISSSSASPQTDNTMKSHRYSGKTPTKIAPTQPPKEMRTSPTPRCAMQVGLIERPTS